LLNLAVSVAYSPPKTQECCSTLALPRDTVHAVGVKDKLRDLRKSRGVRYAASLPERVVRAASALAAGTASEVAAVALPIGFRRTRLYRNLVGVTLQFLVEDVGGVGRGAQHCGREQGGSDKAHSNGIPVRSMDGGASIAGNLCCQ